MLTGFVQYDDGHTQLLDTLDAALEHLDGSTRTAWIDLEGEFADELHRIAQHLQLDAEAIEDCLAGEQRPRLDEFGEIAFLLTYGLLQRSDDDEPDPSKLAVFLGRKFLLTVHEEPLPSVTALRERCAKHADVVLGHGADYVLHNLMDRMTDNYVRVAEGLEDDLDGLEEESLDPDVDQRLLYELSDLRRQLLEVRRIAVSQRELVQPFARGEYEFISEALEQRFSHVCDHLKQVTELVDSLRERVAGVHANYHTIVATRGNEVMKTLTVFASIMLPLALIASIYGMNLPLWPPQNEPGSFVVVLVIMAAITIAELVYFRRKRWI